MNEYTVCDSAKSSLNSVKSGPGPLAAFGVYVYLVSIQKIPGMSSLALATTFLELSLFVTKVVRLEGGNKIDGE